MAPCVDPDLVPDPDNATADEIRVERINVARAYADCKRKQADAVKFMRGMTK